MNMLRLRLVGGSDGLDTDFSKAAEGLSMMVSIQSISVSAVNADLLPNMTESERKAYADVDQEVDSLNEYYRKERIDYVQQVEVKRYRTPKGPPPPKRKSYQLESQTIKNLNRKPQATYQLLKGPTGLRKIPPTAYHEADVEIQPSQFDASVLSRLLKPVANIVAERILVQGRLPAMEPVHEWRLSKIPRGPIRESALPLGYPPSTQPTDIDALDKHVGWDASFRPRQRPSTALPVVNSAKRVVEPVGTRPWSANYATKRRKRPSSGSRSRASVPTAKAVL
jgi:hypothetical protein